MSRNSAEEICCVCLDINAKLNGLNMQDANKTTLHMKLEMCVSEIEWLALYQICKDCIKLLDTSYMFRQMCLKSNLLRIRHLHEKQVYKEELDIEKITIKYESDSHELKWEEDQVPNDIPHNLELPKEDEELGMSSVYPSEGTTTIDKDIHAPNLENESECHKIKDVVKDQVLNDDPHKLVLPEKELDMNNVCSLKDFKDIHKPNSEMNDTLIKPQKRKTLHFPCDQCNKIFNISTKLVDHCIKEHRMNKSHIKPFMCHRCPKKFYRSSNLSQHMKFHDAVRSKICSYCGKGFIAKIDLSIHERRQHLNTREYKCEECGKCFNTLKDIRVHKHVRHSDPKSWQYHCEICNKPFPIKSTYNRHVKQHIGDKEFECYKCHRKFANKYDLPRHMVSHSDVKEYKCSHCERNYKILRCLKIHMAKIHGIGADQITIPNTEKKYLPQSVLCEK